MSYGCFYQLPGESEPFRKKYLPQIGLNAHATILSTNSRTVITQTFVNPSSTEAIAEVIYSFSLYESSSIVGFTCRVGDKVIQGTVKPKGKANEIYQKAKSKGKTAAILDRSVDAADVFSTRLGNVPAGSTVIIDITLIQELSEYAQADGTRYMIPVTIAPRYGSGSGESDPPEGALVETAIKVDFIMEKGSDIRTIRSPSHPIQVDLGRASDMPDSTFESCYASVKLRENVVIKEDFVLTVNTDKQDLPLAFLETHPTLPNRQALMISLVPKFSLPPDPSEIIFLADRSGSMQDKISTLRSALELFLKSLPLGVPFNIVSFGSHFSALWPRSKVSSKKSLEEALEHTKRFRADMRGTEILPALQAAVKVRYKDKDLEVLVLTDGEVQNQDTIFDFVNRENQENSVRFFTLGLGNSASHSLINGISRAGKGFSQAVLNNEDLNKTVIRMLKGALMPRLYNNKLDMKIPEPEDFLIPEDDNTQTEPSSKPISFWDVDGPLPSLVALSILQAPADLPALYPFIRSTIYILLPQLSTPFPETITLRADSKNGPFQLEIPVQDVGKGQTVHQLAAKKAVTEFEECHGWIYSAKDAQGELIENKWGICIHELIEKECERLGVRFQIAAKYCSFVAVRDGQPIKLERYREYPDSETEEEQYSPMMSAATPPPGKRTKFVRQVDNGASVVSKKRKRVRVTSIMPHCDLGVNGPSDSDDESVQSSKSSTKTPLEKLVRLQTFDGYWDLDDKLLQTVGLDPASTHVKIKSHYDSLKGSQAKRVSNLEKWDKLLATCLVGHFLETQASESKDVWELLKVKADDWVQDELNEMSSEDQEVVMKLTDGFESYF